MAFASRSPGVTVQKITAPGPGINGGSFAEARVFAKPGYGSTTNGEMLPAVEWIASRLALAIGLPTPTGQVGRLTDGRNTWVSLLVQLSGQTPAPPDPAAVVAAEPRLAAGTFIFDVWIYNADRHDENILYHPGIGLWLIDHDQSLLGPHLSDPRSIVPTVRAKPIPSHVFRTESLLTEHITAWIRLIQGLPLSVVNSIIDTGYRAGIYNAHYGDATRQFLRYRSANLPELVQGSRP